MLTKCICRIARYASSSNASQKARSPTPTCAKRPQGTHRTLIGHQPARARPHMQAHGADRRPKNITNQNQIRSNAFTRAWDLANRACRNARNPHRGSAPFSSALRAPVRSGVGAPSLSPTTAAPQVGVASARAKGAGVWGCTQKIPRRRHCSLAPPLPRLLSPHSPSSVAMSGQQPRYRRHRSTSTDRPVGRRDTRCWKAHDDAPRSAAPTTSRDT